MLNVISIVAMLSALVPTKAWVAPVQPDEVKVQSDTPATLVLTDFAGKAVPPASSADVDGGKAIDVKAVFPQLAAPGAYVLFEVPRGKQLAADTFVGTPLVIECRKGAAAPVDVTKIEPLRYAVIHSDKGPMTCVFYFDVAPNTADNFLALASGGYYDGLDFHRIVPGFVIQGGDPLGTGTGGPGYTIPAEFNDHPHEVGALSMARSSDPNSAGSQFFVCLDYAHTQQLDGKYTVFGKVVDGMNAVKAIAATPADPDSGKPQQRQGIQQVEVKDVTATDDPYAALLHLQPGKAASTQPAMMP